MSRTGKFLLLLDLMILLAQVPNYCQNQKDVSYCSNNAEINSIALFAPQDVTVFSTSFIEKTLLGFKDNESNDPLFIDGVFNINDLLIVKDNEISIKEIINYYSTEGLDISDSLLNLQNEIASAIKNYDRFLQINIKSFENYIDYQFILYCIGKDESIDPQTGDHIGPIILSRDKFISSALVDKNIKADSLQIIITNVLKELFPRAHYPPSAYINVDRQKLNGKSLSKTKWDTISAAVGDTIYLDGLYSEDKDTPNKRLKYIWKRISSEKDKGELKIVYTSNGPNCELIPLEPDTFQFELFVDDGVSTTQVSPQSKDVITIISFEKPKALIKPSSIKTTFFHGINQKIGRDSIKVYIENFNKIDSSAEMVFLRTEETPDFFVSDTLYSDSITTWISFSKNTKGDFKISLETNKGIKSFSTINISPTLFSRWHFGAGLAYNQIEFIDSFPIRQDASNSEIIEPMIKLYWQAYDRLTLGLGWSLPQSRWEGIDEEKLYRFSFSSEFEASFKILNFSGLSIGVDALLKTIKIDSEKEALWQTILGLKTQTNIVLFPLPGYGLLELSIDIGLKYATIGNRIFNSFQKYIGLGLLLRIEN